MVCRRYLHMGQGSNPPHESSLNPPLFPLLEEPRILYTSYSGFTLITLRSKKVMKVLIAFIMIGVLIPPASAKKTKYIVTARGVQDMAGYDTGRIHACLVAKVQREGNVFAGTARVMFMLPDGTKITFRNQEISFKIVDRNYIICSLLGIWEIPLEYVEGSGYVCEVDSFEIGSYAGTLQLRFKLKNVMLTSS
jgi:hypothetical protein